MFLTLGLAGCVETKERPKLVFDTRELKQDQWRQIDKACELEAAKAVIPIKHGLIATEQYRKIYVLCAESKGAEFLETSDRVQSRQGRTVQIEPYYYR